MNNINIKTEKIYTFPDRVLYGEYCLLSLLELRTKIVKGEITEQLCFIDENDRAYCYNEFAVPDAYPGTDLYGQEKKAKRELLKVQMEKRTSVLNNIKID
jgi:hypothetical protein